MAALMAGVGTCSDHHEGKKVGYARGKKVHKYFNLLDSNATF